MLNRVVSFLLATCLFCGIITSGSAGAVTGSDWQAGRIIDDVLFTNKDSMSASQIQAFLNAKVGTGAYGTPGVCDTNGTKTSELGDGTRAQYGADHGNPAPFTCLKDYWEVPKTSPGAGVPANNYGGKPIPAGAESAAELIWDAAQRYNINPQVLLVTIQKESVGPLTTDDWPFASQYTYAMGAHCPDSGPGGSANCDPNYAGFSIQISESAALFRYYLDNMNQSWWPYKRLGVNSILYNPNSSCGSSNVNITTMATAALYTYTPYQPNAAALANLYGLGDGCSAYGNRNFWRIYSDWFGTTYADAYASQFYAQSALTDPFYLGESSTVFIEYKNVGNARWYDDASAPAGIPPVHLATSTPQNRSSVFSYGWPSPGRPDVTFSKVYEADGATLASNQHAVEPGQIAEFDFKITPPWNIDLGIHRETFQPVLEGAQNWSMGGVAWLDLNVQSRYSASFYTQSTSPLSLKQNNGVANSFLEYKNSGSAAWYDTTSVPTGYNPTYLATSAPLNRWSGFGPTWPSRTKPGTTFSKVYQADGVTLASNQHIVMPGQIARFDFQMTAESDVPVGGYREFFQPLLSDPYHPFMGALSWLDVNVTASSFSAKLDNQTPSVSMLRGQSTPVFVQYKNTGNASWYDDSAVPPQVSPVHLAATTPMNRSSVFSYGWPSPGRPSVNFSKVYEADGVTLATNQHVVQPGQIGRFEFNISAPWNIDLGTHREYFQPALEGAQNWNIGGVIWLDINVHS